MNNISPAQNQLEPRKIDVVPHTASAYLDPGYWNQRFAQEEHYEWFKDYTHFRHLMLEYIKPSHSVLELGCGNSQLCEGLYGDGIKELTCIDLSAVAVKKMKERLEFKGYKEIKVLEEDMLNLSFGNEQFDIVIEKGTMDVLLVDSGDPWNPRSETVGNVMAMLRQVHRVLKPDGLFISVTFGQPHFRKPFFSAPEFTWSIEWKTFGDGFHYFLYILKKGRRLSEEEEEEEAAAAASESVGCIKKIDMPNMCLFQEELDTEDYIFRIDIIDM